MAKIDNDDMISGDVVKRSLNEMFEGTLDDVQYGTFDNARQYKKITNEDRKIIIDMLDLTPIKKKVKTTTYIIPTLTALSSQSDLKRSVIQHSLIKEQYSTKVDQEFNNEENKEFRNAEIAMESRESIDVSEFDENDFGVLDMINKIIANTKTDRGKAQKKSTNTIIREAS